MSISKVYTLTRTCDQCGMERISDNMNPPDERSSNEWSHVGFADKSQLDFCSYTCLSDYALNREESK